MIVQFMILQVKSRLEVRNVGVFVLDRASGSQMIRIRAKCAGLSKVDREILRGMEAELNALIESVGAWAAMRRVYESWEHFTYGEGIREDEYVDLESALSSLFFGFVLKTRKQRPGRRLSEFSSDSSARSW